MLTVRTEIVPATAPTGEAIMRVRFCGDGGECVTVDIANGESTDQTVLIERARAVLIQTATFSMAENEYDAQSNGNPDEVQVTTAQSGDHKIYVFEYRDEDGVRHVPPAPMPSVDAARTEAMRGAMDLLADMQARGRESAGWLVRVRDGNGEIVHIVDAEEAEAARQLAQEGAMP